MVEKQEAKKRAPLLKAGLELSSEGYSMESYLNKKGYEEEQKAINKITRDLGTKLVKSLKFPDEKSGREWDNLAIRPTKLRDSTRIIIEKTVNNTSLKDTVFGTNITYILITARDILTLESTEKQKKLATKNGFCNKLFEEYERHVNFNINGNLLMRIGNVSMLDFFRKPEIAPAEYYNSTVNSWLTKNQLLHEQILLENEAELTDFFPNTSKQLIQEGCGQILGITGLTYHLVTSIFNCVNFNDSLSKEIIQKAKDIAHRTDALEQKVFDTVFDPTSPFFLALKEKFEIYLNNEDPIVKVLALQKLGLKTRECIVNGYRKAKKIGLGNDEYSSFYMYLANLIKKYNIEESPHGFNVFTRDDVIMFANENDTNKVIPTFEDLRKIKMEILQKSSKLEYIIDPSSIDWQGLIEPATATIQFYKDFPNKTDIILYYESYEGEKVELSFEINTKCKEEKINWNFLENPDDPEMLDMKNAALLSVRSALLAVQKQAETEYQERLRKKAISVTTPLTADNSQRVTKKHEEIWIPKEKVEKPKAQKPLNIIQEIQNEILPQKEKGIKKYISLSMDNGIEKMMDKFSLENQTKIFKAIKRFNEDGAGRFKALGRMHEGKTVFELRVNRDRVLVVEEDSNGNGFKNFRVIEIGKRADIFKRHNIAKYFRKS